MSGFGTVVGFGLAFFVLIFTFVGIFFIAEKQVLTQLELLERNSFEIENFKNENFEVMMPFYSSGRLSFQINNTGKFPLEFKRNNDYCFEIFSGRDYVEKDNFFVNLFKPINFDYFVIESNDIGLFSFKADYSSILDSNIKFISCNGNEKTYFVDSSRIDWWDNSWEDRLLFLVENPYSENLAEYQMEIDLNSSNFDFYAGSFDDLRVLMPLKEALVLDLTFDTYSQTIPDKSRFLNTVYLGNSTLQDDLDPSIARGIISNGLFFDGINDTVRVIVDDSLELNMEVTYSFWVKWEGGSDSFQTIYFNGDGRNSIGIVNDGGVDQGSVFFNLEIEGIPYVLNSNDTLQIGNWHFVSATFDGNDMRIYIDGELSAIENTQDGMINSFSFDNYIGSEGSSNYFNGYIDELKVFNVALHEDEVIDLYYNNLRFRELDFYISNWDLLSGNGKVFAKMPVMLSNSNITLHIYYKNNDGVSSNSNIENTFSYKYPRLIGYPVSEVANSVGLSIMSLYDDNVVEVGSGSYLLNELESTSIVSGSVSRESEIRMKYLSQVEANGGTGEIIAPISWAGTKFHYRGFRAGTDRFCILSPFGTASVQIYSNGGSVYSGSIGSTVSCVDLSITTANQITLRSDLPVLVSTYGISQDSFVMYPAISEPIFGIPSNTLLLATGINGAEVNADRSSGGPLSFSLGVNGSDTTGGNGAKGSAPGFRLTSDNPIGAIQQADSDGTESTVFVPEKEMGVKFGSAFDLQYLTSVSTHSDANCTLYNSLGNVDTNIPSGTGSNGLYKYDIDVGNNNFYLAANWKFECDKPIWIYYEKDSGAQETNLLGHMQMRQFVYPTPTVTLLS